MQERGHLWIIKISYRRFCLVDKYHCLMPVEYESEESDGIVVGYHKKEWYADMHWQAVVKMRINVNFEDAPENLIKTKSGMSSSVL